MSVRYRWGGTRITAISAQQWGNELGDANATSLPVELTPRTDVFREPLSGRQAWSPVLALSMVAVTLSLLTTTLAPTASQPLQVAPHSAPATRAWQPANTSYGTPATLLQVAQVASQFREALVANGQVPRQIAAAQPGSTPETLLPVVVVAPPGRVDFVAAPLRLWQPHDSTRGTPKGLTPDAQLPVRDLQHTAPDRIRSVADTSRGTQLELFPAAATPLPPGTQNQVGPQKAWWQPQVLTYRADNPPATSLPPPIGTQTFAALQRALWQPSNTSGSVNPELLPVVVQALPPGVSLATRTPERRWIAAPLAYRADNPPAAAATPLPPGEANWSILQRVLWQPASTASGTPKGLTPDDTVSVQQQPDAQAPSPPDRIRPVYDTSRGTQVELFPIVVTPLPPGVVAKHPAPHVVRSVTDTSQSTPASLLPIVAPPLPPGSASWVATQRNWWQPADGSLGTRKPLTLDKQLPVQNLQHAAPDRVRPVVDTSQGAYPLTHVGAAAQLVASGTISLTTPSSVLYPPSIVANPPGGSGGGGKRHYPKHILGGRVHNIGWKDPNAVPAPRYEPPAPAQKPLPAAAPIVPVVLSNERPIQTAMLAPGVADGNTDEENILMILSLLAPHL